MMIRERIEARRNYYSFYVEKLSGVGGIEFVEEPDGHFSKKWLTTITIDPLKSNGITREDIRLTLEKENIESRPLWKPMHLQPVFASYPKYSNGISENLFENGLCLPSGSNLVEDYLNRIITIIKDLYK